MQLTLTFKAPLHFAFSEKIVAVLVEHGAKVNARTSTGDVSSPQRNLYLIFAHKSIQTPLHVYALNDAAKSIEVLLRHGADITAKNVSAF